MPMYAFQLKKGDVVRAPWRDMGDDVNLTGVVIKRTRDGSVVVLWNGDGDVTPARDESTLWRACPVEKVPS